MRPIKFRAWDLISKKMLRDIDLWSIQYGELFPNTPDKRAYKLMQFTGLKDKNGKEIYSGDIVKAFWKDDEDNPEAHETFEVKYKGGGYFVPSMGGDFDPSLGTKDLILEVIGNIYENPELLKEEK